MMSIIRDKADKLLALRENIYEMHFHKCDREWLIDAMVDFAENNKNVPEVTDKEIDIYAAKHLSTIESSTRLFAFKLGAKLYRELFNSKLK